jgi:Flp pilus assembly pilin Flp
MTRKLPVFEAFKRSIYMVWDKRAFAFAISWPYLIVQLLILGSAVASMPDELLKEPPGDAGSERNLIEFLAILSQGLFLSIMAIYWHRNILMEETAVPAMPLRFDAYVWRYIGYGLLLALITVGIITAGTTAAIALFTGVGSQRTAMAALLIPSFVIMLLVTGRLSLVLPAAAVGDRATGLRRSWQMTAGNSWRIVGLYLLVVMAVLALAVPVGLGVEALGATNAAFWLQIAGNFILNWLGVLLGLAMLSLVYAWFRHEAPPADSEMVD